MTGSRTSQSRSSVSSRSVDGHRCLSDADEGSQPDVDPLTVVGAEGVQSCPCSDDISSDTVTSVARIAQVRASPYDSRKPPTVQAIGIPREPRSRLMARALLTGR